MITALNIQLKKGEHSLKEKAEQVAELQKINTLLQEQLQDMPSSDQKECLPLKRVLTLDERIKARKTEVEGSKSNMQDQELRALKMQMDEL